MSFYLLIMFLFFKDFFAQLKQHYFAARRKCVISNLKNIVWLKQL